MSNSVLFQVVCDIFLGLGLTIFWMRTKKTANEDSRLSTGLQLLQSKISVLEDLSDRSEVQVKQLNALLERKVRDVQKVLQNAEAAIRKIDQSTERSMEVARIFQDKIPHEEILERKNTIKYVQAARLAHEGHSVEEIMAQVDIPRSEVEFITKVNREELMFNDKMLPEWLRNEMGTQNANPEATSAEDWAMQEPNRGESSAPQASFGGAFDLPQPNYSSLEQLGDKFREACTDYSQKAEKEGRLERQITEAAGELMSTAKKMTDRVVEKASQILNVELPRETPKGFTLELPPERPRMEAPRLSSLAETARERPAARAPRSDLAFLSAPEKTGKAGGPVVKKVEFPRITTSSKIDMNKNLS